MSNDSSLTVTRDLIVRVVTPENTVEVKLNRLAAQVAAAALQAHAGSPSRGTELNASRLGTVPAEAIRRQPRVSPVARLGGRATKRPQVR